MKKLFLSVAITAAFLTTAAKAETINCTEITVVPTIITAQGVYCLKRDKSSALASGNIIDIQTNNVTIDLNGFKLGGLGAGTATTAVGIHAQDRQNITIRNGSIRGFFRGILLNGTNTTSSGHLIEDVLLDTNRFEGIAIAGSGNLIRNNRVVNTGPNGVFEEADAIFVAGSNTVVADNIISGTSETGFAVGILVSGANLVEVRNNTILGTNSATTKLGINVGGSADVTLIGNRIRDAAGTGTTGIAVSSSTVDCISNIVAGFTTAIGGCTFVSGNVTH